MSVWPLLHSFNILGLPDCAPIIKLLLSAYFLTNFIVSEFTCSGLTSEGNEPKNIFPLFWIVSLTDFSKFSMAFKLGFLPSIDR